MPQSPRTNGAKKEPDIALEVVSSTGNVFADLELPNPDLAMAKAELVQRLRELITQQGLTQAKAGTLLGLDQSKVSALLRGRVNGYSLDRLFRYLNALGQQVEISVHPVKSRERGSPHRKILITR